MEFRHDGRGYDIGGSIEALESRVKRLERAVRYLYIGE